MTVNKDEHRVSGLSRLKQATRALVAGALLMTTTADILAAGIDPLVADVAYGLANPQLAVNVSGGRDKYIDLMKTAPAWVGHLPGQWGGMSYSDLAEAGVLDANGWVKDVPDELTNIGTIFNWSREPEQADERKGVYVVTYEGEGTLALSGDVRILSQEDGKVVFENLNGKNIYIGVTDTDPHGTGDYIRNISMVREEHLELHEAGAVFNPAYIELLSDMKQIRFMNWQATNNSTTVSWEDRAGFDSIKSQDGRPIEEMVQLANEIGADPWFNMPHMADEEYVRNFAIYVRDNLDPELQVRVEYSNEVWNFAFSQTKWLYSQAQAEWGEAAYIDYHAKMAVKVALIWEEVFGDEADARLINVLGSQATNPGITKQLLDPTVWAENDPDGYVDPASVFEEIAISDYFGSATILKENMREDLLAAIKDPGVDAAAWLAEKMMDPSYKGSIPNTAASWQEQQDVADSYGLKISAYEGGQHLHHSWSVNGYTAEDKALMTEFMIEFVRSDAMADLYEAAWNAWVEITGSSFMQYEDIDKPDVWGSWGMYESMTELTSRGERLVALNEAASENTLGGGAQYQNGVTVIGTDEDEIQVGTSQEDYLIGKGGNDIFVPGLGDDGVHGGDGFDVVVMRGSYKDYTFTIEGNGWRVTGLEGSDLLIDIEQVEFSSKEIFDLTTGIVHGTPVEPVEPSVETPQQDAAIDQPNFSDFVEPVEEAPLEDLSIAVRGDILDATGYGDVLFGNTDNAKLGLVIEGVHNLTALGKELGVELTDRSYFAYDREGSVEINGETVSGNYWSMQSKRAGQTGTVLGEDASDVAKQIGSVVLNVQGMLVATNRSDIFRGRDADDKVSGGAGNDIIMGKEGNDLLFGGSGNDCLYGDEGNDTLSGGANNDKIYGGLGIDVALFSGDSADYVLSFAGKALKICGTDGNDELYGVEILRFESGEEYKVDSLYDLAMVTDHDLRLADINAHAYYEVDHGLFAFA